MTASSVIKNDGVVSSANSTTTALGASDTFTGDWELITRYASISIIGVTDSSGTIFADFSTDGTNLDRAVQLSNGEGGDLGIHSLIPVSKYFRVRVVNGAAAQTYMRVQSMYHIRARIAQPTSRLGQNIGQYSDVINTRVSNDIDLDTSRGVIAGRSVVNKFGSSQNITPTEDVIQATGAAYTGFLTAAAAIRIKAGGNAADDAGGVGAQSITIEGLNAAFVETEEVVVTAGGNASLATSTTFIRVFRVSVTSCGTYATGNNDGTNVGDISIETSSGVLVAKILAQRGQTQLAAYTIPSGKTGYLAAFAANIDGTKSATVRLYKRENADDVTTPFSGKRLLHVFSTLTNYRRDVFKAYPVLAEKTDIWVAATKDANGTTSGDAEFEIILIDN